MLSTLLLAAAIFALALVGIEFIRRSAAKQSADIAKEMIQSQERLTKITSEVLAANERLLSFIDKNIHERVVYAVPDNPYSNEHKFEAPDTVVSEEDDEPEEMGPEEMKSTMEPKQSNKSEGSN